MTVPSVVFHPSPTYDEALERAATLCGLQADFWDIFGEHHVATPEARQAILSSLGIATHSKEDLDQAVEQRLWEEWSRPLPHTLVVSQAQTRTIPLSLPEAYVDARAIVEFRWEDGSSRQAEVKLEELPIAETARLRGERFMRKRLPLPADAPLGYHTVLFQWVAEGQTGLRVSDARLTVCPDRAYRPPLLANGGKSAGVAVSLYSLRSARNWGVGDTTDLQAFCTWAAASTAAGFVALNPLHSIPNRQPYNTSPYLPNGSFYRNFLYLDVESVPEFTSSSTARRVFASAPVQQEITALRASKYVEYERVACLKRRFLKLLFREFLRGEYRMNGARGQAFRAYCRREGALLERYAVYCALDEVIHRQCPDIWLWTDWPAEYRDPSSPAVAEFTQRHQRTVLFYQYLQWELDQQLAAAQSHAQSVGMPIGLYHDLALATDRFGSDLWAHRDFYVAGCRVGSPPDDFSPKGQDWSFPPPNSLRHRADGYQLFRESIRKNCQHGGALRIDHVMRFFRLFWIPDGMDATQGVYVRDYDEDLLRVLALESVRQKVIVIGEDLGTVEPRVREALARFGILSYRLLYFEKSKDGSFKRPAEYPEQALVSVTTHDLPTVAGFWAGRDIEARRAAGLLTDDAGYHRMLADRALEKQRLLDVLSALWLLPSHFPRRQEDVPEFTGELHHAVIGFLASTPSELLVLNQEDIVKDPDQQNLPGSTEQYPNWRHKMRFALDELNTDPLAVGCAAMVKGWIERTGRAM